MNPTLTARLRELQSSIRYSHPGSASLLAEAMVELERLNVLLENWSSIPTSENPVVPSSPHAITIRCADGFSYALGSSAGIVDAKLVALESLEVDQLLDSDTSDTTVDVG